MRLADRWHRPLQELGEQMTAEEFELWQVFLKEEPLSPGQTAAVAEIVLTLCQGLLPKKHGSWRLADFLPERWLKPKAPVAPVDQFRMFKRR